MPLVDKNTRLIQKREFEPEDKFDEKQELSILQYMGYKGLTRDRYNFIVLKVRGYAEMVLLHGRGVKNLTNAASNQVVDDAGKFFRDQQTGSNISFRTYSFKVSTKSQQYFWGSEIKKLNALIQNTEDKRKKYQLQRRLSLVQEELSKQESAEIEIWNREYLMLVFANTKEELIDSIQHLRAATGSRTSPFSFSELSREEKVERLSVGNNPLKVDLED